MQAVVRVAANERELLGFFATFCESVHLFDLLLSHNPAATISRPTLTLGNPPLGVPLVVKTQFGIGFDVAAGNQAVADIRNLNQIAVGAA